MQLRLPRADRVLITGFSPATLVGRGRPVNIHYMTNTTIDKIALIEGETHTTRLVPRANRPGVTAVIPQPGLGDSVLSLAGGLVRDTMRLASDPTTTGDTA